MAGNKWATIMLEKIMEDPGVLGLAIDFFSDKIMDEKAEERLDEHGGVVRNVQ
jgi:hypothetical protein